MERKLMKTISVRSCVASIVTAVVLLAQISPALAGAPQGELAMTQGSRFPGMPEPSRETARNKRRGPVEITFTKWITTSPLMEGFTGGDVPGVFVGEVFQRQVSRDGRIIRLEAVYEVQAGDHSFTALIRGGTGETKSGEPASVTGAALLDGVILAGWRTGAQVHVAFQTMTNCAGAPDARTCFEGTIRIERAPEE
jgi:hypothetical protein